MFSLARSPSGVFLSLVPGVAAAVLACRVSRLPLSALYCLFQRLFVAANDLL